MIANKIYSILIAASLAVSVLCLKSFEIDGIQYIYSDSIQTNWHLAIRYCRQKGMYLLDFESDEEYSKVRQHLRDHVNEFRAKSLWTSGTSLGTIGGEYYWFTSGAAIINTDEFQPNRTNNNTAISEENCLEISRKLDFRWSEAKCDRTFHFICRATKYFKLIPQTSNVASMS